MVIRGAVQGVGFRPFIYRLATGLGLSGWVRNSSQGVLIEVEGARERLEAFLLGIERERPPRSFIHSLESAFLDPVGLTGFKILESAESGAKTVLVLPDIATCPDCLGEVFDPADRRYLYPFTNCTNCGPRFSIIEALPYDRVNTTMKKFTMCQACAAEYHDPLDRRFHAQPNACPECGPQLELWDRAGKILSRRGAALIGAAEAIRRGEIVAVKGLGGFHLMVDGRNHAAIDRLRRRKHREEKPFALMCPSVKQIESNCRVSEIERRLLLSPESPIVLLERASTIPNRHSAISRSAAPGNPYLGVMLPYTPLHHLLLSELDFPIVATSGNLTDEPICTDELEALERLSGIADLLLVHDRPIARHLDDSIVRVMAGRELVMRRARGYAPLPLHLSQAMPPVLATGADLKSAIAISVGNDVFISQHIGDLETAPADEAFRRVTEDFEKLYDFQPSRVACDLHPDYRSTRFAESLGRKVEHIQHHCAHVAACMAENEIWGSALGVAWDGTGYGLDGTIWGGEFLQAAGGDFHRVAHLRTFPLPGGERAVREPRRIAIGMLYQIYGARLFEMEDLAPLKTLTTHERGILRTMLERKVNTPLTSSAGRLFDAVAAITGLRQTARFEGQAAMELEFALGGMIDNETYPFEIGPETGPGSAGVIDWEPMIRAILDHVADHISIAQISARFHNTLVESIIAVARLTGEERICLSGGCFQNRYLTERAISRLREVGLRPYWHQRIPPNDGGIALGQVVAAAGII